MRIKTTGETMKMLAGLALLCAGCCAALVGLSGCDFFVSSCDALRMWSSRARSAASGSNDADFARVSADPSGNVYAAGNMRESDAYGFDDGVSVQGVFTGFNAQ